MALVHDAIPDSEICRKATQLWLKKFHPRLYAITTFEHVSLVIC